MLLDRVDGFARCDDFEIIAAVLFRQWGREEIQIGFSNKVVQFELKFLAESLVRELKPALGILADDFDRKTFEEIMIDHGRFAHRSNGLRRSGHDLAGKEDRKRLPRLVSEWFDSSMKPNVWTALLFDLQVQRRVFHFRSRLQGFEEGCTLMRWDTFHPWIDFHGQVDGIGLPYF